MGRPDYLKRPLKNGSNYEIIKGIAYDELTALTLGAVDIDGVPANAKGVIKTLLLFGGFVGYDSAADIWARVAKSSMDIYGNPFRAQFAVVNGRKTWSRELSYEPKDGGAFIIYARENKTGYDDLVELYAGEIAQAWLGVHQNLKAAMTPRFVVVDDAEKGESVLSIERLSEDAEDGDSLSVIKKSIASGLNVVDSTTPFVADKFNQLKQELINEYLSKIGISSANTNKRERVQGLEVEAASGEVRNSIKMVVDYVNEQLETYGLADRFKMVLKTENPIDEEFIEEPENEPLDGKGANENGN